MRLQLEQPWWLLIALAAVPLCIVGWRWMVAMSSARRVSAIVARALLMGLLAVLLAGATMLRRSERVAVIAVVDSSASVQRFFSPPRDQQGNEIKLNQAIGAMLERGSTDRRADDLMGVVYVDAAARAVHAASVVPIGELPTVEAVGEGTDLERALRLAGAMIPPDAAGRIVLVSDGNQTSGDAISAARSLATPDMSGVRRAKVPVDIVPLEYRIERETYIDSVDVPQAAPSGATITLRVVLVTSAPAEGELLIACNDQPVGAARRLSLPAGRHVELVNVPLGDGRTHRFLAEWRAISGDTVAANNTGTAFTATPGKGAILIVDGLENAAVNPGGVLADTLRASGFEVQAIGPEGLRSDLLWLQGFDAILLQNVAADAISPQTQAAMGSYVSELGGGLVMIGGPASFGAGGWKGSAIEPLLPVLLDVPEKLETSSTAIVLVIDHSGSMNRSVLGTNQTQQDVANEGAAMAIESLNRSDMIGVIVFDDEFATPIPLRRNLDAKANAAIVRSISPDGGTNLPPALEEAGRVLRGIEAETRHIIVLSDGVSMNSERLQEITERIAQDGIKVSTIAVGNNADVDVMSGIAKQGGGVFYRVIDPTLLPRVFVKAVRVVKTPLIREQAFVPQRLPTGSTLLDGLGELPALNGLALAQARVEATVSNVLATETGEPVLASWSVGLGRVAAFTSDAHRWALPWMPQGSGGSSVYGRFWTQLVRDVSRPASDRTHSLEATIQQFEGVEMLRVRLEQADEQGKPIDGLSVPASVYGPSGERVQVKLSQVGPGVYEGLVRTDQVGSQQAGTYVVSMAPRVMSGTRRSAAPIVGGVVKPPGLEYRKLQSSVELLERVAEITGGRVRTLAVAPAAGGPAGDPGEGSLFDRAGVEPAIARLGMWRWLLMASIGVMLLDVATRRIAWDRLLNSELGAQAKRAAVAAMRDRGTQAAASVGRLRTTAQGAAGQHDRDVAASTPGPKKLGDSDAAELAEKHAQRRVQERVEALRARGKTTEPRPTDVPVQEEKTVSGEDQGGGLLEAKKRARRRYEAE